jgi:hypothetical protein
MKTTNSVRTIDMSHRREVLMVNMVSNELFKYLQSKGQEDRKLANDYGK